MKLEIVDCFCTESEKSGNRAGVITEYIGSKEEKQYIAKELSFPVTVFLENKDNAQYIEYFYPDAEMPLCLHGTIAAAYTLLKSHEEAEITIITKLTDYPLKIKKHCSLYQVITSKKTTSKLKLNSSDISKMLNLTDEHLINDSLPMDIYSVGSPKLLIPLKDKETLTKLQPDFSFIKEWSIHHQVNGLYVYIATKNEDIPRHFLARGFNPKAGHFEDAATGVAAAALGLALQRSIHVEQGYSLATPCKIVIEYESAECILVWGMVKPHYF